MRAVGHGEASEWGRMNPESELKLVFWGGHGQVGPNDVDASCAPCHVHLAVLLLRLSGPPAEGDRDFTTTPSYPELLQLQRPDSNTHSDTV